VHSVCRLACPAAPCRLYDWNLAGALSRIFRKHQLLWTGVGGKFKPEVAAIARTVKEFDEAITIHNFGGWPGTLLQCCGACCC
jgi:hypothetical protein